MKASKITAVDFFEDLSSPYARKRFFVGFIAFSILCLIFLYFVEHFAPEGILRNVAIAILVQLLSSCIIVIFFYFLYLHFIGPPPTAGQVTTVRAEDIKPRLRQLTDDASRYTFWGRSGSYFRAVPLIELDRISRKNKKNIDIEILLPDPTDANLIKSYNGIIESLGEVAETDLLLCNVVATTLACAILCANNKFLNIRIWYSKFLPAFRVDLSDKGACLTQDAKEKSALFFEHGSEFFDMLFNTIRSEASASREIIWNPSVFKGLALDEKSCTVEVLVPFIKDPKSAGRIKGRVASLISERPYRYK